MSSIRALAADLPAGGSAATTTPADRPRIAWLLLERVVVTVLLFQGDSPLVAESFAAADPYVTSGVVSRWRVRQWETVVGAGAATPLPV